MNQSGTSRSNLYKSDLTSFHSKLLECMGNGLFCDVVLKVGEKIIPAHRVILASAIPYFEKMISGDFMESKIEIRGIDPDILESLISLCYGQGIELNIENVESLLYGADFLQLTKVKSDFAVFFKAHLDSRNVLRAKKAALKLNCAKLLKAAEEFIDSNFSDLANSNEFVELESNELIAIIKRDELKVSEDKVYEAVMKWVKYAIPDRSSLLPEVLSNVRMSLLSPLYLYDVVRNENLIQTNPQCKFLLEEATNYHMISGLRKLPENIRSRPRNSTSLIYVFGGESEIADDSIPDLLIYDPREDKWTSDDCHKEINHAASAVFDGKLYCFGGLTDNGLASNVEILDLKSKKFTQGKNMKTPIESSAAALLGDLIYVCGGRIGIDEHDCLNSTHCYSPKDNSWTELAPLNKERYGHGAVSINGEIYVIGGYNNEESCLETCENYDPQLDIWSFIKPMLTTRAFPGVAVMDGKIFVCGGETLSEQNSTNSVEVYDPSTDEWIHVAPMKARRSRFVLTSVNKKLYAMGGYNWYGEGYLSSCEVYDSEKNHWCFIASLPEPMSDMAGCSVPYEL